MIKLHLKHQWLVLVTVYQSVDLYAQYFGGDLKLISMEATELMFTCI